MKIAFIGFGEAARAFVKTLNDTDGLSFSAYDILLDSEYAESIVQAGKKYGVTIHQEPKLAIADADWVISAVTAADSFDAAKSVAESLSASQQFIDLNSVSAERKKLSAEIVMSNGANYIDMAVMAPVHPHGHRTPALFAGHIDAKTIVTLDRFGFRYEIVGKEIGAAASMKMIRSLFVKGLEAITVQALLAAKVSGTYERVNASLEKSFARLGWPEFPAYEFERVATHGIRRAAEMRESAEEMKSLGFLPGQKLADAIADVQQMIGDAKIGIPEGTPLNEAVEMSVRALKR